MSFSSTAAAMLAAIVAASLGIPTATASEAVLSRLVLEDPTGDVWLLPADEQPVKADMPSADAVGAVAVHGRHQVKVTAMFTDLQQVDPQDYSVQLFLPSRRTWDFTVSTAKDWEGQLQTLSFGKNGEHLGGCEETTHRIDYATESVAMAIPRNCLGRPKWVRVLIDNHLTQESVPHQSTDYWDNPHNSYMEGASPTRRLFRAPQPGSTGTPARYRAELTDPAGDVWTDAPGPVLAPNTTTPDMNRAVLAHRPHRLAIRLRFDELVPGVRYGYEAWTFSNEDTFRVWLDVSRRNPAGVANVVSYSTGRVDCERARGAVDYDADRVVISVPSGCLGKPAWLRTQLSSYSVRTGSGSGPEVYIDNAHNGRAYTQRFTPRLYAEAT